MGFTIMNRAGNHLVDAGTEDSETMRLLDEAGPHAGVAAT